jgi:hypothetical protein
MRPIISVMAILFGLTIFFAAGCGNPVKKEVLGIWYIEEIDISGDTSMVNPEQYRYAIEEQKNLRFELKEDSIISIYTGLSEIKGIWYYDRKSKSILVTLEGNMKPTRLGKYVEGDLINSDTNNLGTIITTTFKRIVPVEEE